MSFSDPMDKPPKGWMDFACSYGHDRKQCCLTIRATSFEDAESRLRAIGAWGRVDGVLHAEIPATYLGTGFLVKLYTWVRNFPF